MPLNNFRLFFTMDPRHGELSPAMRNRGVEIFVVDPSSTSGNDTHHLSKEKSDLSESPLQIAELAYYSNAYTISRRYELMKRLKIVSLYTAI